MLTILFNAFKLIVSNISITVVLFSSGSSEQNKAVEQAKQIQSAVKSGKIATTANDYTMNARINRRDWVASSMMPPDAASRIVGYYENEYIGLPYSKTDMVAGKKIMLGEDNAVDLSLNDGCHWAHPKRELEIT